MKTYHLVGLVVITLVLQYSAVALVPSSQLQFEGPWSNVSEGLRGRLVTDVGNEFGHKFKMHTSDCGKFALFLELQNTNDETMTLVIPEFFSGSCDGFRVAVQDAKGVAANHKNIVQGVSGGNIRCALMLSPHSSYRYRISVYTYAAFDTGLILSDGNDKPWLLNGKDPTVYSVSLQFSPTENWIWKKTPSWEVEHLPGCPVWRGKLSLPSVKLPSLEACNAAE